MQSLKHISALLLSLLIGFNAVGMTVHKHYCMGRLKVVTLDESKSSCKMMEMQCSLHEESEKMPCCETESELISLEEAKIQAVEQVNFSNQQIAIIHTFLFDVDLSLLENTHSNSLFESPPIPPSVPIFIQLQSFLI